MRTLNALLISSAAARFAAEVLAASGLADELAFRNDQLAAGIDVAGVAAHLEAFEHGVVDAHVVGCGGDGVLGVGIPEDDVGVAAGGEHALLRIHAEDARGRGGDEFDEAIEGEVALAHAVMMEELQAVFDARAAVGNLGEVVFAERLLIFEAERAVVGGDDLQIVFAQAVPELGLIASSRAGAA